MIFNGFPIWFVIVIAAISSGVLIASHFLKMQQKSLIVPTTLFWRKAMESSRRDVIFGKLSSILTLLFLLTAVFFILFSMLAPAIAPLDKKILIIDTCPATNLAEAKKYARELVQQSDRAIVISVGQNTRIHTNLNDHRQSAFASIDKIIASESSYSNLEQAIKEAKIADPHAQIIVLSGQNLNSQERLDVISCPASDYAPKIIPLQVHFPGEFQLQAKAYCMADERFEYCENQNQADLVLDLIAEHQFTQWQGPEFVEKLSSMLEGRSGLKYRRPVQEINKNSSQKRLSFSLNLKFDKALYGIVLFLLLLEIYLIKKHKLV